MEISQYFFDLTQDAGAIQLPLSLQTDRIADVDFASGHYGARVITDDAAATLFQAADLRREIECKSEHAYSVKILIVVRLAMPLDSAGAIFSENAGSDAVSDSTSLLVHSFSFCVKLGLC